MQNKNQYNNLWQETTKTTFRNHVLREDITADVLVIGGGYTGLSAALHMAQKGVDVVLLEAKNIGHGGSGRNVGLVNAGLWTPPNEVEELLGVEQGVKLNNALAIGPNLVFHLIEIHKINCELKHNGTLHCSDTKRQINDLESRFFQQVARDAPVELLGEEETCKRTGSKQFVASLFDPRAGTIQPLAFAKGMAKAARRSGANIYQNSPVTSAMFCGDFWNIETPNGTVKAKKIIQATNAYSADFKNSGLNKNQFIDVHYFQMATEPLPEELLKTILPNGEGCWNCATVMTSFRLDDEGRLLIGAVGKLSGIGGYMHRAWAKRKLKSIYPQLAGFDFKNEWHGRISMSSDHLPKVVDFGPNAISIFGFSGRGISPGTVFGKCAAEWALSGDRDSFPVEITVARTEQFKNVKSYFYGIGAALTHFISARF